MIGDADQLQVRLDREDSLLRVVVSGELDIATVPDLERHVEAAGSAPALELDLSGVTFIDSSGLRLLIEAHRALGERLRILPSPACERLFDVAGVRDRLPLVGN
jgi:anti-sigma B factor antagonist